MLPVNGVLWFLDKNLNLLATCSNRPFQVTLSFCFKARLGARPFIGKFFFFFHANETHFHKKVFALTLASKVRVSGSREWTIQR